LDYRCSSGGTGATESDLTDKDPLETQVDAICNVHHLKPWRHMRYSLHPHRERTGSGNTWGFTK